MRASCWVVCYLVAAASRVFQPTQWTSTSETPQCEEPELRRCPHGRYCLPQKAPAPCPRRGQQPPDYRSVYAAALATAATPVGIPSNPFPWENTPLAVITCRKAINNGRGTSFKLCKSYFGWPLNAVAAACSPFTYNWSSCEDKNVVAACLHKGFPPWLIYYCDQVPPTDVAGACTDNPDAIWWTAP